jgi:hypothetical protein
MAEVREEGKSVATFIHGVRCIDTRHLYRAVVAAIEGRHDNDPAALEEMAQQLSRLADRIERARR